MSNDTVPYKFLDQCLMHPPWEVALGKFGKSPRKGGFTRYFVDQYPTAYGTSCNNDPLRGKFRLNLPPSGCRNSFSSGSDGKAARDDICIERNGMVRPAGWFGCGSSPTVLPSRRGAIIGRQKGVTFESKLTNRTSSAFGGRP